jgi:hypothetical protein
MKETSWKNVTFVKYVHIAYVNIIIKVITASGKKEALLPPRHSYKRRQRTGLLSRDKGMSSVMRNCNRECDECGDGTPRV